MIEYNLVKQHVLLLYEYMQMIKMLGTQIS
jgi:hypothetical protein